MANFAQLDENNVVLQVIVISNDDIIDQEGNESEDIGAEFCKSLLGQDTIWKQTSYNASFRKNYAGVGYIYDETRDAFIPPKPYDSWVLNEETCLWESPIPYPTDGLDYIWNENKQEWELIT